MPLALDRLELRILGVLVEKEKTVPEAYPLTLNALVAGCNQKSNRDPQMSVEPYEAEGALRSLMDRGFVVHMEKAGGRAVRYEHRCQEQLGANDAELALLTELMNRGPQAPGELKTRASRMHPFAGPAEVEATLRELAARPVPYVRQLERRPRERYARWEHLLGRESAAPNADPDAEQPVGGGGVPVPHAPAPVPTTRASTPAAAPYAAPAAPPPTRSSWSASTRWSSSWPISASAWTASRGASVVRRRVRRRGCARRARRRPSPSPPTGTARPRRSRARRRARRRS